MKIHRISNPVSSCHKYPIFNMHYLFLNLYNLVKFIFLLSDTPEWTIVAIVTNIQAVDCKIKGITHTCSAGVLKAGEIETEADKMSLRIPLMPSIIKVLAPNEEALAHEERSRIKPCKPNQVIIQPRANDQHIKNWTYCVSFRAKWSLTTSRITGWDEGGSLCDKSVIAELV